MSCANVNIRLDLAGQATFAYRMDFRREGDLAPEIEPIRGFAP